MEDGKLLWLLQLLLHLSTLNRQDAAEELVLLQSTILSGVSGGATASLATQSGTVQPLKWIAGLLWFSRASVSGVATCVGAIDATVVIVPCCASMLSRYRCLGRATVGAC